MFSIILHAPLVLLLVHYCSIASCFALSIPWERATPVGFFQVTWNRQNCFAYRHLKFCNKGAPRRLSLKNMQTERESWYDRVSIEMFSSPSPSGYLICMRERENKKKSGKKIARWARSKREVLVSWMEFQKVINKRGGSHTSSVYWTTSIICNIYHGNFSSIHVSKY